jgi:uncharacterized membrane protein
MATPAIVPLVLPAHILAGVLALVFGYVALYATKGATWHRKSGMLFVFTMVTVSRFAAHLVSSVRGQSLSLRDSPCNRMSR